MERAKQILVILELVEFRWTIQQVLEQDEQDLNNVFAMKAIGEKMRITKKHITDPEKEII